MMRQTGFQKKADCSLSAGSHRSGIVDLPERQVIVKDPAVLKDSGLQKMSYVDWTFRSKLTETFCVASE